MVLNQTTSNAMRLAALNQFDNITHIGFSDDTTPEVASSNVLTGEFIRKANTGNTKDTGAYTNEFETILTLTDAVGETLSKIGTFTDLAGNTLQISLVLPVEVEKTADNEISVAYQIGTQIEDLT